MISHEQALAENMAYIKAQQRKLYWCMFRAIAACVIALTALAGSLIATYQNQYLVACCGILVLWLIAWYLDRLSKHIKALSVVELPHPAHHDGRSGIPPLHQVTHRVVDGVLERAPDPHDESQPPQQVDPRI